MKPVHAERLGRHIVRSDALVGLILPLKRKTAKQLEVVGIADVLVPGQRVFVEPRSRIGVIDASVDALARPGTGVSGRSLRAVELLALTVVDRISAGNLEFESADDFVVESPVGSQIIQHILPVLVPDGLRRIETVIRTVVQVFVHILIEHRTAVLHQVERLDRTIAQQRVDEPARSGLLRRGVGRIHAVGHRPRIIDIQVNTDLLAYVLRKIDLALITLEVGVDDDAVLIQRRETDVVAVSGSLAATRKRNVVLLHKRRPIDVILPVHPFHTSVILHRIGTRGIVGIPAVRIRGRAEYIEIVEHVTCELVGIHHLGFVENLAGGPIGGEIDLRPALHTLSGRDDNDAVGAASAVNGRRRSILQHVDGLDVRRIQRHGHRTLGRETVDDIKRSIALRQGVIAANGDVRLGADLSVGAGDHHAGDLARNGPVEVRIGGFQQLVHFDFADRPGKITPRHRSVAHAHDLDRIERQFVLLKHHIHLRLPGHLHRLGPIAKVGEDQGGVSGNGYAINAFGVRRGTIGSLSVLINRRPDDGRSGGIRDLAGHGDMLSPEKQRTAYHQ